LTSFPSSPTVPLRREGLLRRQRCASPRRSAETVRLVLATRSWLWRIAVPIHMAVWCRRWRRVRWTGICVRVVGRLRDGWRWASGKAGVVRRRTAREIAEGATVGVVPVVHCVERDGESVRSRKPLDGSSVRCCSCITRSGRCGFRLARLYCTGLFQQFKPVAPRFWGLFCTGLCLCRYDVVLGDGFQINDRSRSDRLDLLTYSYSYAHLARRRVCIPRSSSATGGGSGPGAARSGRTMYSECGETISTPVPG
jgi:hypothetical protein